VHGRVPPCGGKTTYHINGPGTANPDCRVFLGYSRYSNPRNFMPTERLSFQSRSIKNLEMSGSASYSTADNVLNRYNESINEWTATAAVKTRGILNPGPADPRWLPYTRIVWSLFMTRKARITNLVRYDNWRNPGCLIRTPLSSHAATGGGQ